MTHSSKHCKKKHMPLIYAFVSRGTNTVLADYTAYTGNFGVIAVQALERGSQGNNAKFTYSCDGHSTSFYAFCTSP